MGSIEKAMKIALKTLIKHTDESPGCDRNWAAAAELFGMRNDPNRPKSAEDEDVALAEHYLVARAYVSCGEYSPDQMKAMVLGYYGVKVRAEEMGVLQGMRHNLGKPVTPPSYKQVLMGLLGTLHGERDLKDYPATKKAPLYKKPASFIGAGK